MPSSTTNSVRSRIGVVPRSVTRWASAERMAQSVRLRPGLTFLRAIAPRARGFSTSRHVRPDCATPKPMRPICRWQQKCALERQHRISHFPSGKQGAGRLDQGNETRRRLPLRPYPLPRHRNPRQTAHLFLPYLPAPFRRTHPVLGRIPGRQRRLDRPRRRPVNLALLRLVFARLLPTLRQHARRYRRRPDHRPRHWQL